MTTAARHMGRGLYHALAELGSARMTPPRDPRAAAHRLAGALDAIGRAHDLHVTIRGDVPRGTALVVSNHVSYLDPLAILPVFPAIPVAKGEVVDWPIVGPIGAALGVVFVARRDPNGRVRTLRAIHDRLAAGVPVLNFPEGTTTPGEAVLPFWRGSFGIAQRLGVPVVPVAIRYVDPALAWCYGATFVPHYLRTAARPRIDVELSFGAPMLPRTAEAPEAMAARARGVVSRLLQQLIERKLPMIDQARSQGKDSDARSRHELSPTRSDSVLPTPLDDDGGGSGRGDPRRAA